AEPHPSTLPPPAGAVVRHRLECRAHPALLPAAVSETRPGDDFPVAPGGRGSFDAANESKPLTRETRPGKNGYDSRRVEIPRTASAVRREPDVKSGSALVDFARCPGGVWLGAAGSILPDGRT